VPKQILIVDDSPMTRRLIRTRVEVKTDWEVCGEAENGAEAIEMVRNFNPDLIILDLVMPVMDGLEAARKITRIAPHTPMLLFTMQNSGQLLLDARAAGIQQVLSKSDTGTDHLISSMRSLLDEPVPRIAKQ
jgi:two-component system, NarL family, nitrate/nitrite response regulator NarL